MNHDIWTATAAPIADPATERTTLERAQAGDDTAILALFRAYLPALSTVVRDFWNSFQDADELRSVVFLGFMEAIHAWDPAGQYDRLGGMVKVYATDAASREAGQSAGFSIPERTLKRFFGILRRANGDAREGERIASDFAMARETFVNLYEVLRHTSSLDAAHGEAGDATVQAARAEIDQASSIWGGREYADVVDRELVAMAFAAVNDLEADVCGLAYGFSDYDPQPDAEIAHRLGLSSRLKALRVRQGALSKMRDAIGA